jgi:hypothetical protein
MEHPELLIVVICNVVTGIMLLSRRCSRWPDKKVIDKWVADFEEDAKHWH